MYGPFPRQLSFHFILKYQSLGETGNGIIPNKNLRARIHFFLQNADIVFLGLAGLDPRNFKFIAVDNIS